MYLDDYKNRPSTIWPLFLKLLGVESVLGGTGGFLEESPLSDLQVDGLLCRILVGADDVFPKVI